MFLKIPLLSKILARFNLGLCKLSFISSYVIERVAAERSLKQDLEKSKRVEELLRKERDVYMLALSRIAQEKAYNPIAEAKTALDSQPKYY